MEVVDRVLSHMNEPDYDMRLYWDLEKLVHAAHMQDVWQEASAVYMQIKVRQLCYRTFLHLCHQASGGVDKDLCACMRDVENNGVVRMLHQVAEKVKTSTSHLPSLSFLTAQVW